MRRQPESTSVTFRCPNVLLSEVDAYADSRLLTRTGIINLALQNYLQSQKMVDKMLETNFNELVKQQTIMAEYQKIGGSDGDSDF